HLIHMVMEIACPLGGWEATYLPITERCCCIHFILHYLQKLCEILQDKSKVSLP
ncbi:hypothetical protein L9F63_027862, partial [Diploptera punctata]